MDYDALLSQVIDLLQREKRVPYRALKRRFDIDDDYIEDLKIDIIEAKQLAVDENDRILVWVGEPGTTPEAAPTPTAQPEITQESHPTQEISAPDESYIPEAERRQLTVMFCDLVGSTELSGQLDAEDYRELVRAYQATCGEVIERFACHIAQTLGDGLLMYSGYPVAHENDAERAVRVGLGILDAMQALNERLEQEKGIRLAVRIGIHTGPVVVGAVGAGTTQEQLALGETPNVAARIQGLAEPDTIVISEATYRLIQGYFDCQELGAQHLRGVSQSIHIYQVLRASGAQSRLDIASTRGLTPLVGRESEVTLLLERWEQAKDGQGQVVLLSGEAGIGKSRLVQVLKDHVAEETYIRLECRSLPYFTNSALYPITDFLQRTLRFQADDTPGKRLEKLEENLSQYRLPLEETVPLFATLLSLPVPEDRYPPLTLSPQRQRQKTLEAIVAIILELSEQQPVLFILEDLHWTDPTTLELLELLIDPTPTASLYVLLTCRPEFQPSWSHRSYLTEMTLNRLSRSQIESIATQVAGGKTLPGEVIEQLVDRTDGVPLYVEEMTKSVLESGVLKETGGRYELTSAITSLSIPATLQDSLMSRLDRLVTAKGIAQQAAVIGRQFSYELLQVVSELDEGTLQRELGRLVEAELVFQRGVIPQATYMFKHALVQDTAYESLLRSTRQQYHAKIATVLETQLPEVTDTQPELLAHHYTEAGLNERAISSWRKAGEQSIQHSAYVEAINHLTKGLEVLKTHPDIPTHIQQELGLQIMLGQALIATKGQGAPEVGHAYNRAQELCQRAEDTSQRFQILNGLWHFHAVRAELPTQRELSEKLLLLARDLREPVFLLSAHWHLGASCFLLGDFTRASEQWKQSILLYNPDQHHTHTSLFGFDYGVFSLCWLPQTLWKLGYLDEAVATSHKALELVQTLSHPFSSVVALAYTSMFQQFCRDHHRVDTYTDELKVLCMEQGIASYYLAWGTIMHGWALSAQGRDEEGIVLMRRGLADIRATGGELRLPYYLALIAQAYGKVNCGAEGLTLLAEALTLVDKNDERWYEAELHRLKGQLLLQQSPDNTSEAETCFQQTISIAQSQSAKSWELRAATSLAKLWQSQGKRDEARELLGDVYGWFTEGFDTADLIDAKTLLDELLA